MSQIGQFTSRVFLDNIAYHIKLITKKDVNKDNEKFIHDSYDEYVSITVDVNIYFYKTDGTNFDLLVFLLFFLHEQPQLSGIFSIYSNL